MKKSRLFFFITLAFAGGCAVVFLSGCAGFSREWNRGAKIKTTGRDLAGRWDGSWISSRNGHHGKLLAVITREGANRFHAQFHATYFGVLTFNYGADFATKQHGARHDFSGYTDLPAWAGGRYSYDGYVEGDTFSARYKSKYDEGRFEMKRVVEKSAMH